ncbi:MAG TPA: ATP-binding protein, partial [Nitrospiria bacterium]|nr:ATP-binding protein [Nitrospiria bacterium]
TYERVFQLARTILQAGYSVILDGAFLKRDRRREARRTAEETGVPFILIETEAPLNVLRDRIAGREEAGRDPSEAGPEILDWQLKTMEPVEKEEVDDTLKIEASSPMSHSDFIKIAGEVRQKLKERIGASRGQ